MIGLEATTLRLLIEHTPAAVAIFDADMRYLAASRRYIADFRLAGYLLDTGSLIGRSHYQVFPEISDSWKESHRRCLMGAVERGTEEPFPREDGTLDWVNWEIHPWHETSGVIGGIVLFAEVITTQKRFERELAKLDAVARERKEKLDRVLDLLPVGVSVLDHERKIVYSNRFLAEFLDLTADELAGKDYTVRRYLAADGMPMPPDGFASAQAIDSGRPVHAVETGVVKENGEVIWASVSALPVDFPDWRVIVTTVDITARKRSEELIHAQRDVARLIGSGVANPEAWQICLDAARRVSGMDCGAISVFNTEDGTLQLVCADGFGEAFVQAVTHLPHDDPHAQMVRTGKAHYFGKEAVGVMQIARDEGLQSMAVVPIRYQDETIGVLNVAAHLPAAIPGYVRQALETIAVEVGNFAVYVRTQDALRASEEKYRSLVEASDAAIVMIDGDGRIHFANAQAAALAGGTIADVAGKVMRDVEPQAMADAYLAQARAVITANQGVVVEVVRGPAWYRSSVQPVRNAEGKAALVLFSATDITELKRTQQELVELNRTLEARVAERTAEVRFANREMERAMRLKDEFLANMSHELRTPLNGILTLSEVILDGVYGDLPPRQERAMRHIDTSGRHLLALINDLLDLSKIEAGKLDLEIEATMPEEVCQASILFVKDLADKKDILLSYNNADPAAGVLADPRRLKQMLVNLLSNAVKFTPDGGRVHLQVMAAAGEQAVEFAVQDTGPGIAREDQARLFQPFMQLDASLAREHDGTGLGLALVRRLAEQHGGRVRVESEGIPGKGSRFVITLPRVG